MTAAIRVLPIDDEPDLLEIGKLFLEREGDFAVSIIDSAHAALGLLGQEQFEAIISNHQMTGVEGITT